MKLSYDKVQKIAVLNMKTKTKWDAYIYCITKRENILNFLESVSSFKG